MIYRAAPADDYWLTEGVMIRRVFAWVIDILLLGLILAALWFVLLLFGVLTLGLGFALLGALPFVPFCYHWLFVAGPAPPRRVSRRSASSSAATTISAGRRCCRLSSTR